MPVEDALQALRLEPKFARNIAAWRHLPARSALYAPYPAGLDPRLSRVLRAGGLADLYTHQSAAIAEALGGGHVAVVTPAASGKTLCYNLPVLHRLLADPRARALYLYPTKALAHDQLAALGELMDALGESEPASPARAAAGSVTYAAYDGDTPSGQRTKIREGARIILSNPDMLHAGILPQHTRWAGFFANLRVVVIDEMHVYRGVFGSHVANVLRRLRRICRFYGSQPQFILASATIANPGELAEKLVESPVTVVGPERNGAPQGERHVLLYNPPVVDASLGIRRSASSETADLAAHFLAHDVQTIVFAGSRLTTELILIELQGRRRDVLRGYRGGYLPRERQEIERGLRAGKVRGVVATNALELGIDIGQLDASLLSGYPGTIASTWQQMGRAGRRQGASAAILVASADALDQYIIAHPEYLFDRDPEHALINPDNPVILADHLACAAAELPFADGEAFGAAPDVAAVLAYLAETGELYRANGRFFWAGEGYPAAAISLRTSSPDRVVIQRVGEGAQPTVIGELDRFSVPLLLYEGAVYMHGGETYLVDHLDWEAGTAGVRRVDVDYYTRPSIGEEVEVLEEKAARDEYQPPASPAPGSRAGAAPAYHVAWGDVRVVSKATGYRILQRSTHEVLGYGPIDLPEQVLETTGCWLAFSEELVEQLKAAGEWLSDPNDYGPNWAAQRAAVRARDSYRCQGCGVLEREGKQHDIHHKIPFRAFVADPSLRPGLGPDEAWQIANRLENLVTLCPVCHRRAEANVRTRSGLGGAAALLAAVAPVHLMCDSRDLGLVVEPQAAGTRLPTITIYEKIPAGIGYAGELYRLMPELLRASLDLLRHCPCRQGCPGCVGPVLEHDYALETKALTEALLAKVCLPIGASML